MSSTIELLCNQGKVGRPYASRIWLRNEIESPPGTQAIEQEPSFAGPRCVDEYPGMTRLLGAKSSLYISHARVFFREDPSNMLIARFVQFVLHLPKVMKKQAGPV